MDTISYQLLTNKDSNLSTMYYTANAQFSTNSTPNLWKSVINGILIAQINIRLLSIRLLNVFTNRRVIR